MALKKPQKWVWDFWFEKHEDRYHIFYLQADSALKDQLLRHWNVSIGHAVSTDLTNWEYLPDALKPSEEDFVDDGLEPADNCTTWTGSIIKKDDTWYMFYTGTRRSENGKIQRVCAAKSDDLIEWERIDRGPVVEADPRWYETIETGEWKETSFRDPFVFYCEQDQLYHMYVTGRAKTGVLDGRGVIAHSVSKDLVTWENRAPVTEPGQFSEMEVPQVFQKNGRYYLIFTTTSDRFSAAHIGAIEWDPVTGTHYYVADNPSGPFKPLHDDFMSGDGIGSLYSGKIVDGPDGTPCFLAFRNFNAEGEFVGEITDPYPVRFEEDGRISIISD